MIFLTSNKEYDLIQIGIKLEIVDFIESYWDGYFSYVVQQNRDFDSLRGLLSPFGNHWLR